MMLGLGYNSEAIEFMDDKLGFINVYKFDLFSDTLPKIIREEKYDYVVMGEILEHVDNPVIFLKK
jgi:2-polyprenyl-3-methyl-5-hydroxy-6-metoxy-1,4-benzoquinol methylase